MRSPNVSTEIVGSVKTGLDKTRVDAGLPYTVSTTDGTLMLVQDEVILWYAVLIKKIKKKNQLILCPLSRSIQVHRQLFSLTKLDVTHDGKDEIVVCSWDGQTYILGTSTEL